MIVDTGVLYAAANRHDKNHAAAEAIIRSSEHKTVPEPVVVETCWMIASRLGEQVEMAFVRSLSGRVLTVEQITREDRRRILEILGQYTDARIGYVDASIVAIAERLGDARIATFDHRHFRLVRPRGREAFELIP